MLKKVISTAVLGVSALGVIAANATPGVYVTGQLGYANNHLKGYLQDLYDQPFDGKVNKSLKDNKFAGRLAVGYQFNQNLAIEMGYLHLGEQKLDYSGVGQKGKLDMAIKFNQYALDLAAKGILPVSDKFNVYGKLGVAYLKTTSKQKLNTDIPGIPNFDGSPSEHKWAPEAAVGVSYNISPSLFVDGSWTHIHPMGGKDRITKNIDFVAVGLGYSFG